MQPGYVVHLETFDVRMPLNLTVLFLFGNDAVNRCTIIPMQLQELGSCFPTWAHVWKQVTSHVENTFLDTAKFEAHLLAAEGSFTVGP